MSERKAQLSEEETDARKKQHADDAAPRAPSGAHAGPASAAMKRMLDEADKPRPFGEELDAMRAIVEALPTEDTDVELPSQLAFWFGQIKVHWRRAEGELRNASRSGDRALGSELAKNMPDLAFHLDQMIDAIAHALTELATAPQQYQSRHGDGLQVLAAFARAERGRMAVV